MKQHFFKQLLAALMLLVPIGMSAQVTIGGSTVPQKGAVLDLNSTFTGGLLFPNVVITDLGKIPATFADVELQNADSVPALSGLMVYNTNSSAAQNLYQGIYVWDGEDWKLLAIDGGMMSIPDNTPGYAPGNPLDPDASSTGSVTISNPGLDVVGQYYFTLIVGQEYSSVTPIDVEAGVFEVTFQANPTAYARRAVILVTDPAGKTATFIFTQAGAICSDNINVTVAAYGSTVLCQGGAIHAYVVDADPNMTYFWLRNGIEVAQGAGVELGQVGTYMVYASMIGCGTPGSIQVTGFSSNIATRPSFIIADNNGILCGTTGVTLSALNAPNPATGIMWLKDGLMQGQNAASYYVTADDTNQGVWYLIYNDANGCSSVSSNKINIAYNSGSGSTLPEPDALINNVSISAGSVTVCAGGTLELTVANTSAYSSFSNVEFEWFGNGVSLGKTTAATMYVVPPSATNLVLSLTVTATDFCPMSKTSSEFTVLQGSTPLPTSINSGDSRAFICASNPAILTIGAAGNNFQWFRNGVEISGANSNPLFTMQTGRYTGRYANASGCWSTITTTIEVIQSAPVSLSWAAAPAAEEIFGSSKTYSVIAAPDADSFVWSVLNPAYSSTATIAPLGNGNAATVTYGNTEVTDYQIKVSATNACGTAELLSGLIHVKAGCISAGSVVITPSSAQTIEDGQSINFTASANTGSAPISYKWFVDGIEQMGVGTNGQFTFKPSTPKAAPGYAIAARASAACDGVEATSSPVQVIVTLNPKNLPKVPNPTVVQPHFFGGKTCLDVHATGGAATDNPWADGGRLPLTFRPNDFNNGSRLAFTYTFSTIGGSNIRFILDDPQNITQSVSGDTNASSAVATVTFRPNILTAATGTTKNTALAVTLYAVYSVGSVDYQENITIRIQDQSCGCPAKVSATTWRTFQCHNPGADTSIDPFSISTANDRVTLRGAWYAWGRKLPIRNRDGTAASPLPSTTMPGGNARWSTWENPCEPGWLVGGREDVWQPVFNNNTRTRPNAFLQFGSYLILPPQGYATSFTAGLIVPNEFHYWVGTASSATAGHNFYAGGTTTTTPVWGAISKNYVEPVRCVQEGTAFAEND